MFKAWISTAQVLTTTFGLHSSSPRPAFVAFVSRFAATRLPARPPTRPHTHEDDDNSATFVCSQPDLHA